MRILMVCLGNICRSPMAEGILRSRADEAGVRLEVDSAGTSGYHAGEAPDERAVRCLIRRGVDISGLRARQFSAADFDRFDRIFVMDDHNLRDVLGASPHPAHHERVSMLLGLTHPGNPPGVPDPWYGGEEGFEEVFNLLDEACARLVEQLRRAR